MFLHCKDDGFLFRTAFLCEADLIIKMWQIMKMIRNTENLRQYKSKGV